MTVLFGAACAVALAPRVHAAPETYAFDKAHSKIMFSINHMGMSNFHGRFQQFDGSVTFDRDELAKSSVAVTIQAASVDTDVERLDAHLRSPDFFDAEKYPTVTFKSTRVQRVSKDRLRIEGELGMHGHTRTVALDTRLNYDGAHPLSEFSPKYKGAYYTSFSARTTILRSDFDMSLYAPNLSDEVTLIIELELRRQ